MRPALLSSLVAVFALTACGGRGALFTTPLKPLPAVATQHAVVSVTPQTNRAVFLEPGVPAPRSVRLSPGARVAQAVPGADVVLVLTGTPRAPTLDLLDVTEGTVETLTLPGLFDRASFSDDGRFAVLTAVAGASTGVLVARNLNEVAVVDLPSRRVSRLQLDTESLAPRAVVFAPPEADRRLVAVTLDRGVALFDALRPEVPVRRITIRPPGSTSESSVLEAVFSSDARWLFLRASALDDVIAIELGPEVGAPPAASLNFVSGGRGLSDLEAAPAEFPDAVLAAYAGSNELMLLDARGIQDRTRRFLTPAPVTTVQRLLGARVLGWSTQGQTVVAWDLVDGRGGSASLDGTIGLAALAPALGRGLFFHPTTQAGFPALSTVTVVEETNRLRLRLQSIQLAQPVQATALDLLPQRAFFSVAGSSVVVTLDLATLQLGELLLDSAPTSLLYLPGADALAAVRVSNEHLGDVTLWPAGETARSSAIRFTDFAFTGDLDRVEAP